MENIELGQRVLFIGLVWPEPTSSAAGTRMLQLLRYFVERGGELYFGCAAARSPYSLDLKAIGVESVNIQLNDASFDRQIRELQPDVVVFDRFAIEEQYGWRVSQQCPRALKILDTEDLHFLRYARQDAFKRGVEFNLNQLYTDRAKREIASILRCDLSLLISEFELELLVNQFQIDAKLLHYLPFLQQPITGQEQSKWLPFESRADFVFIGNMIHEPNWKTVEVLKKEIWPTLSKLLPKAQLHIYGAYAGPKVLQLHQPLSRFLVHGRANCALEVLGKSKILLAPIPFGAGVKGKFIDAILSGTPSVTTAVGAEAMQGSMPWGGSVCDSHALLIEQAAFLYENQEAWTLAQSQGVDLLNHRYNKLLFEDQFSERLRDLLIHLERYRRDNFYGQILQHHSALSSKYMALWIEAKNKQGV